MKSFVNHRCVDDAETFHWMTVGWCITCLRDLLSEQPELATFHEAVDISGYRQFLGLDPLPEGAVSLLGYTGLNIEYARTVDLTRPLLVCAIFDREDNEVSKMVVDGWHRMYRALNEGITQLPVLIVSKEADLASRFEVFLR